MNQVAKPQTSFVANSVEDNAQSLADYILEDKFHAGKNVCDSNFRKFLDGLAQEVTRAEEKLEELVNEYYPVTTTNLLEEWESALGIPDECFKVDSTRSIELRRKQIVAKMALMNLTTTQDFIDLAAFFGVEVIIINGADELNVFPFTFPFQFFLNEKSAFFTMIVFFPEIDRPSNIFPLTFPITFEPETLVEMIICLFEKLKPAPVKIEVRFKDD